MRDIAVGIATKVTNASNPSQLDPLLITLIIEIIMELLPMIFDNCVEPEESLSNAIVRLSTQKGLKGRLIRWRLLRVVRGHLGPDTELSMVRDVASGILEAGADPGKAVQAEAAWA